jgi:urease accessory protein
VKRLEPEIVSQGGARHGNSQDRRHEKPHANHLQKSKRRRWGRWAWIHNTYERRSILDVEGASFKARLAVLAFFTSFAAAMAVAGPADAHMGTGLPGGFMSGFIHPLTGFDHMLAMVSVGLWGAFLGRPLIVALPVIFPTVMAFGAFLGIANVPFPPVEIGIALSVLLLGGAIAAAWRAPVWAACLIVAIFGLFHGYAHGKELPSAADPIGFAVGFVLSTGMLHIAGLGIGLLNDRPGGIIVTRSLGGLVALAGIYYLVTAILK